MNPVQELFLPPRNTTTATLYFSTSDDYSTPRLDSTFTISGILQGRALSDWLRVLLSEHGTDQLNASLDIWHHNPDGSFDHSEITACRNLR